MSNGNGNGSNGNGNGASGHSDYRYDVFLSYSFKPDVKEWVSNKFHPTFMSPFENELIQCQLYPPPPRVYVAPHDIVPGDVWTQELEEGLKYSKVLVAICSPAYFVSNWCLSEWQAFLDRGPELIVPVLYYGNDSYLMPLVNPIQYADFRDFKNGRITSAFRNAVDGLAATVAAKVAAAPPFSNSFPAALLPPIPVTNVALSTL
jgi:hypothetical protein